MKPVVLVCAFLAILAYVAAESPVAPQNSITLTPTSGPAGTIIQVSYTADSTNGFVGFFPQGSYYTNTLQYLSATSATLTFDSTPLSQGTYNVDLVINGMIAATAVFTVGGGSAGSTDGQSNPGGTAQAWLNEHNSRRNAAGIPSLEWSPKLAQSAQNWANTMASQNTMYHSGKSGVGENVAEGQTSISQVMTDWAENEAGNYNPSTQSCNPGTMCGHFTQVMWYTTTLVGCAMAESGNGTPYYCCQYIRPGNCNGYNYMSTNSPCPLLSDAQFNP